MEKTIKEWLDELPEPYRSQALENADKDVLNEIETSQADALSASFLFYRSKQGLIYWSEFKEKLI